jgi:dipeptidyl aminopeptidase/acylaminoacyl peptidase
MHDLTPFEQQLRRRLETEVDKAAVAFDAGPIAAAAMARRSPRDRLLNRLAIGPLPMGPAARQAAVVAVVALLAVVTLALAVGLSTRGDPAIAFIRTDGDVVVAAPDGSTQRVIHHVPNPSLFTQLEWAPDGRHLAIVDEDVQLTIVDRSGDVTHTRRLDDGRAAIAWSPDGQRLAISDGPWLAPDGGGPPLTHPRLEVIRPDGALEWAVPLPPDFRYVPPNSELAWSTDGRLLAITGSTYIGEFDYFPSSVWLIDTVERTVRELTPGGAATFDYQPRWLPDGRLMFARDDAGIMQVDPATGAVSTIFEIDRVPCESDECLPARIGLYELSPDGVHLALLHQTEGVAVLDLTTGALTNVQMPTNGIFGPTPITWTPDGKGLAFEFSATPDNPPSVVVVDVATGEQRVLLTNAGFFDVLR